MKKALICILLIITVILTASCTTAERIIGTWKNQTSVLGVVVETTYVFNEDGTGTVGTLLDIPLDMTYTLDGDILTVTTSTLGVETVTQYTVSFDGDSLVLANDNETITLNKAK